MILANGERYTFHSSPQADSLIHQLVTEVSDLVQETVPEDRRHALVLIGGYGRGEGGIRCEQGMERPNNNLDFLLICRGSIQEQTNQWQRTIESGISTLQVKYGVSVDFSIISGDALRRSSCRVMWYDMRRGHKTVLGDSSFVPSLTRFRLEKIPSWDVHNLLINRGTLLVINDCLPTSDASSEVDHIRARHTIKAVIGYGDALLHAHGRYHWSYAEKQRRMRCLDFVDEGFREIYDLAAKHRFRPNDRLPIRLLRDGDVRQKCESVHLLTESKRLSSPKLDWGHYLETALTRSVWEDRTPRGWARSVRNAFRRRPENSPSSNQSRSEPSGGIGLAARFALRSLSTQRLLGFLFPAIAYQDCPASFREDAANLLQAKDSSPTQLRKSYLRAWGHVVDKNFNRFLERHDISLDAEESES